MSTHILYIIISVLVISLLSFIGIFTLSIKTKKLNKTLIYILSFSAGALLGDAFLHLLPETISTETPILNISTYVLLGIIIFFILEKFIHWQHCHLHLTEKNHVHPFAYTNLFGDALHNFIDGLIIAASYFISIPAGLATTIAVALHEMPQEIGDFGVLLQAGFSKTKALLLNFASALIAIFGALTAIILKNSVDKIEIILVPIAAGGFIYIALSDLIPEIHKTTNLKKSTIQFISFLAGILIMALLLFLE